VSRKSEITIGGMSLVAAGTILASFGQPIEISISDGGEGFEIEFIFSRHELPDGLRVKAKLTKGKSLTGDRLSLRIVILPPEVQFVSQKPISIGEAFNRYLHMSIYADASSEGVVLFHYNFLLGESTSG
jgi:hypothetical protein